MKIYSLTINRNETNVKVFVAFFSIVLISKCLNISIFSNYVPYAFIYASFITIWGSLALFNFKIKGKLYYSTKLMIFLGLFYFIWGIHNIKTVDYNDALGNLIRSLLYVIFVIISSFWICEFNCLKKIIITIYWVFALYLVICFVLYFPTINLISTLSHFWVDSEDLRYRVKFGFTFNNIAGEMAVATIILSKIVSATDKTIRFIKIIINIVLFTIIIANNSRGSLILLIVFEFLFLYLKTKKGKSVKKTWHLVLFVVVITVGYLAYLMIFMQKSFYEILVGTNRQAALVENIRLLDATNNWLMGMGRLTGGYFASRNIIYGVRTGYLEVFYFEVFVTSGITGSIYMFFLLVNFFRKSLKSSTMNEDKLFGKWIFCILIYVFLISFFEVYLFSYVYATSMLFTIILLSCNNTLNDLTQ